MKSRCCRPDGRWVVSLRVVTAKTCAEAVAGRTALWLVDAASGEGQALSMGDGAMEHAVVFTGGG